jgi:5-aminopentanamidase
MTVKIAVVQQHSTPGAVKANRDRALENARQALDQDADIVLFHEELLTGYVDNVRDLAEAVDGETTRAFQALLTGSDQLILYGLTEREGSRYYISAPLVSCEGVVANYRKTHLWWAAEGLRHEPTVFTPGNGLVTFRLGSAKAGIMICYDGDFPEMTRAYANSGCSLVFWMNNRGSRGPQEVQPLARANSMIMATSCSCGLNEVGHSCEGGSNIIGHDGTVLAELWNDEGIIYAEARPEAVAQARQQNPWFTGQRQDLYR